MLLALAIPAGLLIGLSLGALGGGGSILTVPALVYLLHQQPHAATTGSLLIVGITALAGTVAHWRAGRVRVAQGITFGVLGVAGSYAGTRLAANISPGLLLTLFAILMLVVVVAMLRRRRPASEPEPVPATVSLHGAAAAGRNDQVSPAASAGQARALTLHRQAPAEVNPRPAAGARDSRISATLARRAIKIALAATGVGLLTGFFGVGGGFVIVPALVLTLGFEMPAAVGTSLLVISVNSAAALAARLGGGISLDWPLLGVFTVAALAGALAGNRIASKVSAPRLTTWFTVLLAAVAAYTLVRSVPALL